MKCRNFRLALAIRHICRYLNSKVADPALVVKDARTTRQTVNQPAVSPIWSFTVSNGSSGLESGSGRGPHSPRSLIFRPVMLIGLLSLLRTCNCLNPPPASDVDTLIFGVPPDNTETTKITPTAAKAICHQRHARFFGETSGGGSSFTAFVLRLIYRHRFLGISAGQLGGPELPLDYYAL